MNKLTAKSLLALGVILLLSAIAGAQQITDYDITTSIVDTTAIVSRSIKTDFSGTIELNLPKDSQITDISSKSYTFENGILKAEIDKSFNVKYLTEDLIEKSDKYYFVQKISFPFNITNFKMKIALPESAVLDSPESAYPFPEISTDGVNIILEWEKQNLKKEESFATFVVFRKATSDNTFMIILITLLILAAISAALIMLRKKKKISTKQARRKIVKTPEIHLLESESAVIKALKSLGGGAWQKQIQLQTGFSKAKLSRLIRNLEARKLIKKIPLGNTNKIKII